MSRRLLSPAMGLAILLVGLVAAACLRMMIDHPPGGGLSLAWPDSAYAVFRYRSVAMSAIIGAALAVSGVLLQALLRNPLASPFILGLSSGAGLGVTVSMYVGWALGVSFVSDAAYTVPALIGALAILAIVYALGRRRGVLDPLSLVLVGVVLSAMCSAGMMIFELLVPNQLRVDLLSWMMGRIPQGIDDASLLVLAVIALLGTLVAASMGRAMDAATFGDEEARSVGLSLAPLRLAMFALAGILAAATVAIAGPIAFVGLIAPHAARLLVGPAHTMLVFAAACAGALLLLVSDSASAALHVAGGRIPVGVFTALIGGPAFIWLLRSGRGQA